MNDEDNQSVDSSTVAKLSPRTTVILLVVAALAVAALAFVYVSSRADDNLKSPPSPTPSPSRAAATAGAPQFEPSATPAQTPAKFGNTPAPNPTITSYTGEEDQNYDDTALNPPTFQATSDRRPAADDAARGATVIDAVVPNWANNDTSKGSHYDLWSRSWRGDPATGTGLMNRSRYGYVPLWGALSRLDASAVNAKIVQKDHLWNIGSHSLWRVTVERDIRANRGQTGVNSTERVTWDFLVNQDGNRFQVDAYVVERPENLKAETFYLPAVG